MKNIFLLLFIAIFLFACASPAEDIQVAEPTADATPTASPIPTAEPTTTPDHVIESLRNKFYQAGLDFDSMGNVGNVEYKDSTWSIQSPNGEVFSISNVDLEKRVTITKNGNLQILDQTGEKVELAYDPQTNQFLFEKDFFNTDYSDIEKYITVESFADFPEFIRQMKLVKMDPPENAHRVKPGTITLEYLEHMTAFNNSNRHFVTPLGKPDVGEVSVIHTGNFIKFPANEAEGRPHDMLVPITFIPNYDGTWGVVPVIPTGGSDNLEVTYANGTKTITTIEMLEENLNVGGNAILFPRHKDLGLGGNDGRRRGFLSFLKFMNLNTSPMDKKNEKEIPHLKALLLELFETGNVPKEAEKLIFPSIIRYP